jgi:aminoglycoside phosphotransferase family enzyme/predicted kinase
VDPRELLSGLSDPAAFPRGGERVEVVQTHVSVVFLVGDRVYKAKKPVSLWGFLDYSTPERRRLMCEEEVRIGRRFAPEVYLGVLPVVRRGGRLAVGGEGEVVDHVVEMVRVPRGASLAERVEAGTASEADVRAVARMLAAVHDSADRGPEVARAGRPVVFARVLRRNLRASEEAVPGLFPASAHRWLVDRLAAMLAERRGFLVRRAREGRVVEGHGDLRAEHAVLLETPEGPRWRAIDAIEFTPALRCVDPISDAAFPAMDLAALGRRDLSRVFRDAYLEARPDPDAEALWPLFLAYRAQVRALVASVRAREDEVPAPDREAARRDAVRHLALAWSWAREGLPPLCVVLTGPSASGKSVLARTLAPLLGAEVVSSDVVRKRLAGLRPTQRVSAEDAPRVYGQASSRATYKAIVAEARDHLRAGRSAILDATFLRRPDRAAALDAARDAGAVGVVLALTVAEEEAERRILARVQAGSDPSDATFSVHRAQVWSAEPLTSGERARAVLLDGGAPSSAALAPLLDLWARRAENP